MRIATLMSGTLVAQGIMLGFMPLLTRIYTPEEFGVYSLFFSVVSILGLVSSLKYDQAIMLPKSEKNAQALVFLAIAITLLVVCVVSLFLFVFESIFLSYFSGLKIVMWMIPVGVLLIGILQIFKAYSSRYLFYKKIATVRAINAISVVSIQGLSRSGITVNGFVLEFNRIAFELNGFLFKFEGILLSYSGGVLNFNGLIIGKLIADFISLLLLINSHFNKKTLQLKNFSRRRVINVAKRYEQFPKYQSVTVFLNALSQNMPIILLGTYYSVDIAGYYALTVRILKVPIGLIGMSTKEVYYQKASKMYAHGEDILGLYLKTTIGLGKIFVLPFLVVLFFGEFLFGVVFGDKWGVSGIVSQVLIFWFAIGFINTPAVSTFSILSVQRIQMKLEFLSLILRFIAIYIGYTVYGSYMLSIFLFMIVSVGINLFYIIYIYIKLKRISSVVI